jgi:hypothetical protein
VNARRGALMPMGLVAAILLGGCSSGAATAPSAAGSRPGATSATPASASASGTAAAIDTAPADQPGLQAAAAIVKALGGTVAAGAPTLTIDADPITNESGKYVQLGDWVVAWNSAGTLRWVYLQADTSAGATLTQDQAAARVTAIVAELRLQLGAPDTLVYDATAGAWAADWVRKIGGYVARGDGTSIALTPDGQFNSYRFSESPANPMPALLLSEAKARAEFPTCRNSRAGAARTETCTATLIWLRAVAAAVDRPLQLCWEIKYTWKQGADTGGSFQDFDAGSGAIVDSGAISS